MLGLLAHVIIVGFAAYRAARLIARDTITEGLRNWFGQHAYNELDDEWRGPTRKWVWQLVSCPYCLGVWFAAGFYALVEHSDAGRDLVTVLAIAGVQAWLARGDD